jgi:hypothetical protein
MATYTDRITLVFPIAAKNRSAAASLQTLEITDAGQEFEKLVPIDPASVQLYASEFNLGFAEEKATLEATIATLQAKVAELEQYRPFNPRILKGEAFYNRVSKADMVTLLASDVPQLVVVGKTIEAYRANRWPVVMDSTDFQQLVGYVLASGVFDEDEVIAIMRDATKEEAYGVMQ